MKSEMKRELANKILRKGIKPYSVFYHSFTRNRLEGKRAIDTIQSVEIGLSPSLPTRCDCLGVITQVKDEVKVIGGLGEKKSNGGTQFYEQDRIYDNKIATAIPTSFQPYYLTNRERERESDKMSLRIRKLVPLETMKLMGFERKDCQAMQDVGLSDMAIYHCSGDSIITTCLMAIFGQMLMSEQELQQKIENYVERLVTE